MAPKSPEKSPKKSPTKTASSPKVRVSFGAKRAGGPRVYQDQRHMVSAGSQKKKANSIYLPKGTPVDIVNSVAYHMRLASSGQRGKHQTALLTMKSLHVLAELQEAAKTKRSQKLNLDKVTNLAHEFEWSNSFSPPSAHEQLNECIQVANSLVAKLRKKAIEELQVFQDHGKAFQEPTPSSVSKVALTKSEDVQLNTIASVLFEFYRSVYQKLARDEDKLNLFCTEAKEALDKYNELYDLTAKHFLPNADDTFDEISAVERELEKMLKDPDNIVTTLAGRLRQAAVLERQLLKFCHELPIANKDDIHVASVKKVSRIVEKAAQYANNFEDGLCQVRDIARAAMVFPDLKSLKTVLEAIKDKAKDGQVIVVRIKNRLRLDPPPEGAMPSTFLRNSWRDVQMLLCFDACGDPFELQLTHKNMFGIRQAMFAHSCYARYRNVAEAVDFKKKWISSFADKDSH